MLHELKTIYKSLASQNIIIAFTGTVSQPIVEELGEMLKNKTSISKAMRDVFAVFIEMSQNVLRYSSQRDKVGSGEEAVGNGMIFVTEHKSHYQISSGNLISEAAIPAMKDFLTLLNTKNKDELKTMYTERRKAPVAPGKGPGLGLIDISRRADRPLEFDYSPMDAGMLFLLSCTVNKDKG